MKAIRKASGDRPIRRFALLFTFVALFAPSAASAAGKIETRAQAASARCAFADVLPNKATEKNVRRATLCLLNAQRSARGIPRLRSQPTLAHVARSFARQMAREQFLDHVSPSGSKMLSRISATSYLRGAQDWLVGENIAWATGTLTTPRATVQAWMESRPHRANMLARDFTEVGVGTAHGGGTPEINPNGLGYTYVTNFGYRDLY